MEIIVNHETFRVYDTDTEMSILERIAAKLNTTPTFLAFPNLTTRPEFLKGIKSVDVINVVEDMRSKDIDSITEFRIKYEYFCSQSPSSNLLELFIIHVIQQNIEIRDFFVMILENEVDDPNFVQDTIKNQSAILKNYDKAVNENREKVKTNEQKILEYEKLTPEKLTFSEFVVEKVNYEFTMKTSSFTNELLIFDSFTFSPYESIVPLLVTTNNYFKINSIASKDLQLEQYLEDTSLSSLTILILANSKVIKVNLIVKDMILVVINFNIDLKDTKVTKEQIQNAIQHFSKLDSDWLTEEEKNVKGYYFIKNISFQKDIMLDMIMNEPLFEIMYVDERLKVTKKQSRIYCYFNTAKTGNVNFSLTNHVTPGPIGEPYVKVKIILISSKEIVPSLQVFLEKLFVFYRHNFQPILTFYQEYTSIVEDVPRQIDNESDVDASLREQAPDIFLPLYSRICSKSPTIISKYETNLLERAGFQSIQFPKNEGLFYSCALQKEYIYPSLRKNTLANQDVYPYIPCCYKTNHQVRRGSIYRHYYFDEPLSEETTDHELYLTTRIMSSGMVGVLPPIINKAFQDDTKFWFRYGITKSSNSFLECVLTALDRKETIQQIRKDLIQPEYIGVSRQETYDLDEQTIRHWLMNDRLYFDGKYFLKMVEDYFQVSIFLFSRNVGDTVFKNGKLTTSRTSEEGFANIRHSKVGTYMRRKLYSKVILIYEHFGSVKDNIQYPHCELIIATTEHLKKTKGVDIPKIKIFPCSEPIVQNIDRLYDRFLIRMEPVLSLNLESLTLLGQFIDKSGKTRIVYVNYKEEKFSIFTEPIHPLRVEAVKTSKCYPLKKKLIEDIQSLFKLSYKAATHIDYICHSSDFLKGVINGVKVRIYVEHTDPTINVERHVSVLTNFMNLNKIARLFFEYVCFKFSLIWNINNDIREEVATFKNYCKVIENFEYNIGPINQPLFSKFDAVFLRQGKIIFDSEELLKRTLYNLILLATRQSEKLRNLKKQVFLNSYFQNLKDFKGFVIYGKSFLKTAQPYGELLLNEIEPFPGTKFLSIKDIENGRLFIGVCYNSMEDIPEGTLLTPTGQLTTGMVYILDNSRTVQSHEIDSLHRIFVFRNNQGVFYIKLKAMNEF